MTVTVVTNKGSAAVSTPFQYDALFAADGDGGGAFGSAGDLYMIDPFAQRWLDLGPLVDNAMNAYGISGLAFGADGTLYGVTTGDSPADSGSGTQLVTIDPVTATVTAKGSTIDGNDIGYEISDIKVYNNTLYGWSFQQSGGNPLGPGTFYIQGLVTIDKTNGVPTPLTTPYAAQYYDSAGYNVVTGGIAIDGAANMTLAAAGAAGEWDAVDYTTGEVDATATVLDFPYGAPINSMTISAATSTPRSTAARMARCSASRPMASRSRWSIRRPIRSSPRSSNSRPRSARNRRSTASRSRRRR